MCKVPRFENVIQHDFHYRSLQSGTRLAICQEYVADFQEVMADTFINLTEPSEGAYSKWILSRISGDSLPLFGLKQAEKRREQNQYYGSSVSTFLSLDYLFAEALRPTPPPTGKSYGLLHYQFEPS